MGYKYKATMYYSDDETEAFLREKALKTNGKKSASHYLYSLISREREVADTTRSKMDSSGEYTFTLSILLYIVMMFQGIYLSLV